MKNISRLFLSLMVLLSLTGCGSKLMSPALQPQVDLSLEQTSITFFRSSSFGGAIQAPIAEMVENELKLVGIVSVGTKIRHIVSPGNHVYVIGGESGDIIKATLASGKNYYVRIEPRMGVFKARFAGVPVSSRDLLTEKVQKQFKSCVYVVPNSEAEQWFLQNKSSMLKKFNAGNKKWDKESVKNKAIVLESYGVDEIY